MAFGFAYQPSLVIANGASTSNIIVLFEDAYGLSIQAPGTLTSTTITVQGVNSTSTSLAFATIQSGGVDITLSAGKMLIMTPLPVRQLSLLSGAAEGDDRVFTVAKVFPV